MKKLLIVICIASLLFSSCLTTNIFDDSISEEKTARINIERIGNVTEYNAIPVSWNRQFKTVLYQIPAGDTLLQFDVDAQLSVYYGANGSTSRNILRINGALFKYNFQPQKVYVLYAGVKNGVSGINVYAWNYGEKMSGTPAQIETHFLAFVPFLNVSQGGQRKVLN